MKHLVLAPLLFVLSSCSNDISVKTDLGEKYIVKDTAVTVIPFGLKDLVKTIKEDEYVILDRYSQCTYTHGFKKNTAYYPGLGFTLSYCEKLHRVKDGKVTTSHGSDLYFAKKEPLEENHFFRIKFRPIFIDLNKQKNAAGYEYVHCINPKLEVQTLAIWDSYKKVKSYQPEKITYTAYQLMKSKVCDKYAKFE